MVESDKAVVTVETRGEEHDPFEGGSTSVWRGCGQQSGTQVELLSGFRQYFSYRDAFRFELASPFVAFLISEASNKYESSTRLATVDLRAGVRWESRPIAANFDEHAVNGRGDIAWIRRTYGSASRRLEWRLFVRHENRVARRGTSFKPLTRLRLSATRVAWREGGRRRSLPIG